MFKLIKQVFIALLSFSRSLSNNCVSLSIEPCIARPTFIDLSPIKLNYYSFMISLDKFNRSCDDTDDLATKTRVPNETKDINVKVVNMIARRNAANIMVKHILCSCKLNLIVQNAIQIENGVMINANASVKTIKRAKRL